MYYRHQVLWRPLGFAVRRARRPDLGEMARGIGTFIYFSCTILMAT